MTQHDRDALIELLESYWSSWDRTNRQKNIEAYDMLATWDLSDIDKAIREARQSSKPDAKIFEVLKVAQSILRSRPQAARVDWVEQRLEEHRQHYAGNRAAGLEWPGDEAVREMIRQQRPTPLQQLMTKRLVDGMRAAIARK